MIEESQLTDDERAVVNSPTFQHFIAEKVAALLAASDCELARLRAANAELQSTVEAQNDPASVGNPMWLASRMQERAEKAEAANAELVAALKPFAEYADLDLVEKTLPDISVIETEFGCRPNLGDCRAARAALAKHDAEGE